MRVVKKRREKTFAEKAKRQSISFGPSRAKASTESRSTPCGHKPLSDDSALPGGWHCEDGFVVMGEVYDNTKHPWHQATPLERLRVHDF